MGPPNSGKSYSRRTIPDGENVIILAPSNKVPHLRTSTNKPLKPFDIKTTSFDTLQAAMAAKGFVDPAQMIDFWNYKLPKGSMKAENLTGNVIVISNIEYLPVWFQFISDHLPWIHTVICPDFTHFISSELTDDTFINRKAGGDAYQKFWELSAKALRNFITTIDKYRHDLIVVTEYHGFFDELTQNYDIFVPAGKMLTDKFLPTSYYDILLFTDVKMAEKDDGDASYYFVTKAIKNFKYARAMNLFEEARIPNDLQLVLTKMREYIGIELPV